MTEWQKSKKLPVKKSKFLEKFEYSFISDISGSGGCETCGYGAEQGMSADEFDELLIEIDQWITQNYETK